MKTTVISVTIDSDNQYAVKLNGKHIYRFTDKATAEGVAHNLKVGLTLNSSLKVQINS